MVYKCQLWWRSDFARIDGQQAVRSDGYGTFSEHDNLRNAILDKVALLMTSMKGNNPDGAFYATVIEYPQGYPPETCTREMYETFGGDNGN